jgi:WD40 repeat protein
MLAATVVVVAAGGVTAAVLALSSHGNPLLATLAEPDGATPTVMAFESDGTLVTADSARAYSWDIATRTPTQVDYESTAFGVTSMTGASGIISTEHITADSPGNVLQVWNSATGRVMATLAAPRGTVVNVAVLSPDGTEVAAADSDGLTYIWKIAG